MLKRLQVAVFAAWVAFVSMANAASPTNYVVNGNFETGFFPPWIIANQTNFGSWFVSSGGILPLSNFTTPPPPEGAYAAIADQTSPSSMILYQDIALPANLNLVLQYTYYYNNHNDSFSSPDTLNINNVSNQQARIDIMNPATSDPYSVAPGDVLKNLLRTLPGAAFVVQPTTATFDLTPYAGQTIRLRFAVADNNFYFSMGIDNVSIRVVEVLPPLNLTGTVLPGNNSLTYRLQWDPSPTAGVTEYIILRNGVAIAIVPACTLFYEDPCRKQGEVNQYSVVAFVSTGLQSDPTLAEVIIPQVPQTFLPPA